MTAIVLIELAFLFGSLRLASVVERLWGVDLHAEGTGNVGAGNASRVAGRMAGALLAVLDGLKGLLPVLAASQFGLSPVEIALVGLAAVAGNNWPVWRTDRGGRGLATSVGVVVGSWPGLILWPGVWSVVGWKIGGGIAGFLGWGFLPVYVMFVDRSRAAVLLAVGLAVMMAVRRAQGNAGFQRSDLRSRIVRDHDPRPVVPPERPLATGSAAGWAAVVLVAGLPVYVWATGALANGRTLSRWGVALLAGALVTEVGAKYVFGELFRDGASRAGIELSRMQAFRAALVGTGVARLIPVGGAVTPIAMAWSVRDERESTIGAAVRATVLNYGALMTATGLAMVWVMLVNPDFPTHGAVLLLGIGLFAAGSVIIAVGGRLRMLRAVIPRRWRSRVDSVLFDCGLTGKAAALLSGRVALEAATLGLTLAAFGSRMPPSQVVAAFGASQLVGGLPGSPGGLGITEAGLVGVLILLGVPAAAAPAPVFAFRFISYWIPAIGGVAAGGSTYLRHNPGAVRQ